MQGTELEFTTVKGLVIDGVSWELLVPESSNPENGKFVYFY